MSSSLRVVVLGILGRSPVAGVAWQGLHYLEGLRQLGHEVFYVEDTGDWPFDPELNTVTADPAYTLRYLGTLMQRARLDERWAYRAASQGDRVYGPCADLDRLFADTDIVINLTGATRLNGPQLQPPVRIYVETDPVAPQIELALGTPGSAEFLALHTHHFTYGENLGAPDCGVPLAGIDYRATRQPVVLEWWYEVPGPRVAPSDRLRFTTIANWRQEGRDLRWNGNTYTWSKHYEFEKVLNLPRRTEARLELALSCAGDWDGPARRRWIPADPRDAAAFDRLQALGWTVVDATTLSMDLLGYRSYIAASGGEFTVAKDQNVRLRSGWFSDRSACYLAAGRPVVTQDTGFGNILPCGEGLFAFRAVDDAATALEAVIGDYEKHSRRARDIAAEYFDAQKVLADLLARVGA